ncbi:NUDIX domain-containing protein [Mesorhizobium sp. M4B.F.Ca.ET.089.01.1.1]|nr:NUDIX domain-containing protein [Mesorhizobium sp. M4B.F.Ca.ET.049.02.1.2]RVD31367.1 NUDIX domain-containing protein [Mesorhizobium sp. M4B.F.Ca.ET.017.02.2.1]RWA62610.1 MAG: NUDIX domain-containing protein [Mesorhizobium sp.]RWX62733.1 NUDIX domain-containing protein [Mesorhizobium sp. M4B.F.Ca.ET.089.01.1.1]TGV28465.1 NUDIX domain-containing protein [Mesorhizobium sp. M4B.F.Ca.ET.143.01.1.1]
MVLRRLAVLPVTEPLDPEQAMRQTGWPGLRARLFHLLFLLRRPMTLGVRGLVHDRASNSVFLIRHTYVPGWQLPGGGVEVGETLLEALARELAEEGNITIAAAPVLKSVHFNRRSSRRDHVGFYLIESFKQTAPKAPDHEIAEAGFFPLDRLPEATTPATLRRIAEIFAKAEISPYW